MSRTRRHAAWRLLLIVPLTLALTACDAPAGQNEPLVSPRVEQRRQSPASTPAAPTPVGPTATATPAGTPSRPALDCTRRAAGLTRAEQVGQLFMVAVASSGLSQASAGPLRSARVGSVILLGNTDAGVAGVRRVVAGVRAADRPPSGVRLLIAVDQEGGLVQRLSGTGFSTIPSAEDQADLGKAALRRQAQTWGEQLGAAGIDANLAPVADVVPAELARVNQPIGVLRRGFGSDPAAVADDVSAVVAGMDRASIATAVKHFPGLGRVRGNTDFVTRVVDTTTTRHDKALAGFAAGIETGVDMVMMSSAVYSKIDPDTRAVFSRTVVTGMVRNDLGFTGVVISDDLAAPGVTDLPAGSRALRFLRAGGDLIIVGDPSQLTEMVRAVKAEAAEDPAFAREIQDKAARVLALKARRGLVSC